MQSFFNPCDGKVYVIEKHKQKGAIQQQLSPYNNKAKQPSFLSTYTPFIVYIILGVILILILAFLPTRAITKFFAASVALSWTSFWSTIIYFICLGGSKTAAWFVILIPLFISVVFTIAVLVGYVNLESVSVSV